jgi:dipeptidyl aminopeptidase/acylaminoacyl peptidase
VRLILLTFLCAAVDVAAAPPLVGPTVHDIVEFTQIVQPRNDDDDALHEQVSPDGTQAFIVTRKADVASDKNRYEIQLLDLTPDHLAAQRVPAAVTVFSAAASRDNSFFVPAIQDVQWHGDRTLVFLARLGGDSFQVYRLDLPKRELVQLTHETNLIVSYAVSQDLQRAVYAVQVPNPPLRAGAHSVVVDSQSFWSVKFGQNDLRAQQRVYQFFVADVTSPRAPRALGSAFEGHAATPIVSIAPDGRWALLPRYEPQHLAAWERQYPMIEEASKKYARSQQVDPLRYFSNPLSYVPRRMTAWRLDDGKEQMVVDAPNDALPGALQMRADRLWQGTGTSVVLAGTHLPLTPDGKTSSASHVIEYWPDRGQWADIATLENRLEGAHSLADGFVVLDGTRRREFHRQAEGGWRESTVGADGHAQSSAWTLHVVQGLNQSPDVYASGPSGETARLTQLNPQFKADTWGTMLPYTWRDAAGRQWDGGLMSGSGMDAHTRYPLLIQTYGFSPDRFYLDGPNTADGFTSGFAGRAFLREGILVLAMPWSATNALAPSEHQALQAFNVGVRGAVDALVKEGRVDPSKVGIIGWSATGERVLNLVTFGDVPIRAATMADGDANTLFSFTLTFGTVDSIWGRKEAVNEGLPFGDKLATWVRNDSALHTDCIHAALRIETYGPWVLNNWDVYALLRRQYKPAEMIVIPDGTHSLLTPGDRMVSLQGNMDWYAFWLAGKTRTAPLLASETTESVAAQFARWRQMETLKAADDVRPRCMR